VLSRNNIPSTKKISLARQQELMKKLNKRKIRWIVQQVKKREFGLYTIAKLYDITPQHARHVYSEYKNKKDIIFNRCGRKPKEILQEEEDLIISTYKEYPIGAVNMEELLKEKGKHIPHNRIHRIMKKHNLAITEPRKSKRRKWIRYERRHSNSLWHADWFDHNGENIILIEDDASRFLVGFGVYNNANAVNSSLTLKKSVNKFGKPKQLITDHGTHFMSLQREDCENPEPNKFQELLIKINIQHIKARVKHPQTNGKVERLVGTLRRYYKHFKDWNKTVKFYNYKRPHMSLTNGHLRTPYQAFLDKKRKDL